MLGVTGKHNFVFPSIVRVVWLISGCVYWMTVTLAMECAPTFRYDRLVPQRTPPSPQLNPHHPTTPSLVTILPLLLNPKELWNNIERSHQGRRHITNRVLTFVFINSNTDTHAHCPLSNHLHSISHGGQKGFLARRPPRDNYSLFILCPQLNREARLSVCAAATRWNARLLSS